MKKYILTHKYCFPSARILRDAILNITGRKLFIISDFSERKKATIRFGNSQGNDNCEYNRISFINLMSNKLKLSNLLLNSGIYAPKFEKDTSNIVFPCIIRKSLNMCGGRGMHIIRNMEEFNNIWKPQYYWTEFRNLRYEFRVHIVGGEIIKIFKKTWRGDGNEPEYPIRVNNNYKFVLQELREDRFIKLREIIGNLNNIIGVNCFYALDIGMDTKKGNYIVLEGNTAPGLNEQTAKLYANFLTERLGV